MALVCNLILNFILIIVFKTVRYIQILLFSFTFLFIKLQCRLLIFKVINVATIFRFILKS